MPHEHAEHSEHCHAEKNNFRHQAQTELNNMDTLSRVAELFKVFGDTTRIRILFVLFQQEECVCDIAKRLDMTQSAISHQLRILKQARLIRSRREGKTVYYALADDHVGTIFGQAMEHIAE